MEGEGGKIVIFIVALKRMKCDIKNAKKNPQKKKKKKKVRCSKIDIDIDRILITLGRLR